MQIMAANKKYPAAGGTPYVPDAVEFGSGDYLTRAATITGISDADTVTQSFWVYVEGSEYVSAAYIIGVYEPALDAKWLTYLLTDGRIGVSVKDASSTYWNGATTVGDVVDDQWNHVLIARSGTTRYIYINDAATTHANVPTAGSGDFANASNTWSIGARSNGSLGTVGLHIADLWWTTEYVDISVEANRRKFIDANGDPVDLGSDGSTPTGTAAPIFFKGDASTWNAGTNSGGGEDFTVNGAVIDSDREPVGLP